jgi:hypothetical protein
MPSPAISPCSKTVSDAAHGTPITSSTATTVPDNVVDKHEVPLNDPGAIPGLNCDPYSDPVQAGFYRTWHITVNAWGLGVAAPTLADIPTIESRPKWGDHPLAYKVGSIVGYGYSLIAVWDTSVDVATTAAPTIDPDIGYKTDPWCAPEYLEDMDIAKVFQRKTGLEMICHTRRQLEVVKLAMAYGVRAKSIKDIPICPPILCDQTHYWVGASEMAWEATHSSFIKKTLKSVKSKIAYLFVGADGRPDLKNITWMIALILGTAQASNGTVTNLMKIVGL